jgi:DUF35 OB-fold domain, acyl-CoA-associated
VGASGLAQVVEVVKRLRGETSSKREFKRGLTQSTGGLGTNNFVTILQRADAPMVQNLWPAYAAPDAGNHERNPAAKTQALDEGVIETFTILYVTPDGFLSPLALALIRTDDGRLLMAQGEDETQLKIGQEVYLRRIDGVCLFTVKGQIQKVQDAFIKLFRRNTAMPAPK